MSTDKTIRLQREIKRLKADLATARRIAGEFAEALRFNERADHLDDCRSWEDENMTCVCGIELRQRALASYKAEVEK